MPLVALDHITMAYGHLPLLDDASLLVESGERVSVIGRNGSGKSTLLQIINGEVVPDAGTVWRQPALRVARLEQDVPLSTDRRVRDVVADGFAAHASAEGWHVDVSVDMVMSRQTPSCRHYPEDGADAYCSHAPWSRSRICCCSTNRRIISTSTR
jgi:ATP-binding cassette subfamily F protein uup